MGAARPDGHPPRPHRPVHGRRGARDEPLHPRLARPRPRGRRAVQGLRRAGDARAARRRLRRRPQGVDPLARRQGRHRPGLARSSSSPSGQEGPDPHLARRALGEARPPRGGPGRPPGRHPRRQPHPRRRGQARRARAPPARDRRADRHRAGDDEGRRDEDRAGHVVPRRRPRPRGVPRGVPGQARRAARRGPEGLLQGHEEGPRGRVRREARGRLRELRPGPDRRRLDRPGLPGAAARRTARRGQGPVPRRRERRARRHAEHGDDPAAHEARRAGARPQGDGRRRSARASTRSSTTSSRPRTSAPSRASTAATRSSSCPRWSPRSRTRRSIVSEYVHGRGFEELKQLPDEERDRIGEIIFRFYFGCMYRHHQFSGDPHPGNSLLLDDGRMAFIDFGLFKRIPAEVADIELESARLGIEGRGDDLIAHLHRHGFIGAPEHYTAEGILAQFHDFTWWYTSDEEIAARAGDRHRGDDPDVRPALGLLRQDAPRDAAARPPLRPAPGDAHASR